MNDLRFDAQKWRADSEQDTGANHQALILIAEDEPEIADILAAYLARSGMRAVHATDGIKTLALHSSMKPDLILLDIQMPKMDGWKVLTELRQHSQTPVIMLTAMDQDVDKLVALRIGADDYVIKPFNPAEVVARVQAVLRRTMDSRQQHTQHILRVEPFEVDLESHAISINQDGQRHLLSLTLTEFKLLTHFIHSPKRVFTRGELLEACLPEGDTLERTVDSHISKLRKKLEVLGIHGIPAGVRGVGYRFRGES
ncbi:response regulator [Vibrio spartinae]|nr:response regulator [Vibrio spartinae]